MAATILDGKQLAEQIRRQTAQRVQRLAATARAPMLAAVLAGDDGGAVLYAESQAKKCAELGIAYRLERLPGDASQADLLSLIDRLNRDDAVDGVILQQPLPKTCDAAAAQSAVRPDKDVEGASPMSLGLLAYGRPALLPCTALAAWELIKASGIKVEGANAVVIGRSQIVGRPIGLILMQNHATVTTCHTRTRDLPGVARTGEILVVAAGRPRLVTADYIRPGAVVIDVGTNRVTETGADGKAAKKTVGDVDFEAARQIAGSITPVPGGVGPVTVALLLRNVVEAAERHIG
ncbi:MAG: bifunctional 5,10-methylenetetrahydrofolate dehydrogenase/5,10-methenyltetrahydrofolate cyclohydrolase [Phycisphaerae bacterium]|nr:bifunctional 5,10-methylenetetrahydrofolate dehydrogenase/5,10-methenyltetrahydrofolate cyclohydrolase [Phycisphaerae bacterium]